MSGWSDQQRYVRVDDIGRASPREQLAYPLTVIPAQCFGSHTRQYSCEIGLLAAITPDLTDNRGTRTQRRPLLLEHAQLSTHLPVTPVDGDQRSGIEYRLHATSGRGARPSRDAAASSSASVKEPSSDSQASKAAPSSSFLSLSAAASLSQADTLIPCRSAALRTPSPRSGGIVTENLSTCAMHTIISHTLILNSANTAAHPAVVHLIQQSARRYRCPEAQPTSDRRHAPKRRPPLGHDICAGHRGRRSARTARDAARMRAAHCASPSDQRGEPLGGLPLGAGEHVGVDRPRDHA